MIRHVFGKGLRNDFRWFYATKGCEHVYKLINGHNGLMSLRGTLKDAPYSHGLIWHSYFDPTRRFQLWAWNALFTPPKWASKPSSRTIHSLDLPTSPQFCRTSRLSWAWMSFAASFVSQMWPRRTRCYGPEWRLIEYSSSPMPSIQPPSRPIQQNETPTTVRFSQGLHWLYPPFYREL